MTTAALEYLKYQENQRANQAREAIDWAKQQETAQHNRNMEQLEQQSIDEQIKHNRITEDVSQQNVNVSQQNVGLGYANLNESAHATDLRAVTAHSADLASAYSADRLGLSNISQAVSSGYQFIKGLIPNFSVRLGGK